MSPTWRFGVAVVAMFVTAPEGRAQAVRVRARQDSDRRPLVGVLVSLRDAAAGRVVRQVLTDEAGRALLRAAPGRFAIRADRIGYPGASTEPFVIAGTDTVVINLVMSAIATRMADLDVVSSAPVVCALEPATAGPVAALWTEARKALAAADLTAGHLPMLEVTRYERLLGEGSVVAGEQLERFTTDSLTPFIAADPAHLAKEGYLERRGGDAVFYAPDARVLLSDEFLAGHCFFGLAAADSVGLVGLGFEPAAGSRRGADVRGALWLDRGTFELRFLEFTYTDLAREFRSGQDGGRVDFVRLPGGGWLTSRWRVRVANRERGGNLAVVGGRRGVAVLAGQANDSLAGTPLMGAVISVAGGAYRDTTEADGRYRIEVPMSGEFTVTLSHPLVTLVGGTVSAKTARLTLGGEAVTDFGIPSRSTLEAARCPRRLDADAESLVVGRVVDSSGMGQIGSVRVAWPAGLVLRPGHRFEVGEGGVAVNVVTDSDGRFQVCGVPAASDLQVAAVVGARRSPVELSRVGPAVRAVRLVVP